MKTATTLKAKRSNGSEPTTAQPIIPPPVNGGDAHSPWLRLPTPKQRLWGLSRTTWAELCDAGVVRSIVLRKRHAQRGIRLVSRESADAYFKSLLTEPAK